MFWDILAITISPVKCLIPVLRIYSFIERIPLVDHLPLDPHEDPDITVTGTGTTPNLSLVT